MNNNTNDTTGIPVGVLELLPWYAIGKLPEGAQAVFEDALQSFPTLQNQLDAEQQMIGLVSADIALLNPSVIGSQEQRLKSVYNVIDQLERPTQEVSHRETSLLGRLKNAFDSLISGLDSSSQYARFAGVSVLVVSIAVLASLVTPSDTETSDFITASAVTQPNNDQTSAANATKTILLVGFNGTKAELINNDVLKGKQIKIGIPVNHNGFFQISFEDSMSAAEVKQTIDALLAQKETFWFAGEAF